MMKLSTLVLLAAVGSCAAPSVAPSHLPIINDDYARARTEAAKRNVPVFIEVWAPW
jgi:hypothetical protein